MKVRPHRGQDGVVRRGALQSAAARLIFQREQPILNSTFFKSANWVTSVMMIFFVATVESRHLCKNLPLCIRYKIMELICYTVMGVFPALVILSMVSKVILSRWWSLKNWFHLMLVYIHVHVTSLKCFFLPCRVCIFHQTVHLSISKLWGRNMTKTVFGKIILCLNQRTIRTFTLRYFL